MVPRYRYNGRQQIRICSPSEENIVSTGRYRRPNQLLSDYVIPNRRGDTNIIYLISLLIILLF